MKRFFPILFFFLPGLAVFAQMDGRLISRHEIFFDFGKHDLRAEADSTLRRLAEFCKNRDGFFIAITAHTDSIGSVKNNQALSERRAESVSYALVELGVPATSIRIEVYGEGRPAARNNTEEGRQKNRRATVGLFQKIALAKLEGRILDPESGKGKAADVVVHSKEFRDSTRSSDEGYWHINVPEGVVVGVDVYAEGYFFETKMLKALPGKPSPVTIELKPAKAGARADVENLYFVGNQAILLEKSKPELPKLLRFMQINSTLDIEIAGHVNHPNRPPVVKESWEYKLSEARAKLVYDYLLENGIPAERVSWKGYGNWEMRYPHATSETDMALNRRVEIRVR